MLPVPDDCLAHTLQYLKLQHITQLSTTNKHYHGVVEHYLISLATKFDNEILPSSTSTTCQNGNKSSSDKSSSCASTKRHQHLQSQSQPQWTRRNILKHRVHFLLGALTPCHPCKLQVKELLLVIIIMI